MVHKALEKEKIDNLILSAPSIDLTNLDTVTSPMEVKCYVEQVTAISAENMFNVAVNANKLNPNKKSHHDGPCP